MTTQQQPTITWYFNNNNVHKQTIKTQPTQHNSLQNNIREDCNNKKVIKEKKYITYETWNCYRGILGSDNQQTEKMIEIKD